MPNDTFRKPSGFLCTGLTTWLCLLLCACAVNPGAVKPEARDQMLSQLGQGRVILDCTILCAHEYIFRQNTIIALYANERWEDLGIAVMQAGWRQDVTYFLLGVSAEQQGFLAAADGYYRIAGGLATNATPDLRCATVVAVCQGLEFPRDIQTRLAVVDAGIAAARGAEQSPPFLPPQCQSASATLDDGTWYDSAHKHGRAIVEAVTADMWVCREFRFGLGPYGLR